MAAKSWIEKMAADAPKQHSPPNGWLDQVQRNTQRNELDASNTPAIVFWLLTAVQIPVCAALGFWWGIPQSTTLFSIVSHAVGALLSWFVIGDAMFFDVWGEVTISIVFVWSYLQLPAPTARQNLCTALAALWVMRLGGFLGWRILVRGWDWRFAKLMDGFAYNMFCWVCQGTWIFLQCVCVFAAHSVDASSDSGALGILDVLGAVVAVAGMAISQTSDMQKSSFNKDTASGEQKKWIQTGLWRYSRHPNYFGENLAWVGIGLVCWSCLPWTMKPLCLVSPIWSCFFLVFTSLSLLEKRLDKKFGGQPDYEKYKQGTSCLVPWPFGWGWTGPCKIAKA